MIYVPAAYKDYARVPAKEIAVRVWDANGHELTEHSGLVSFAISAESALLKSVMRQGEIKCYTNMDFQGEYLNIAFYYKYPTDDPLQGVQYGSFKVIQQVKDEASGVTTLTIYDRMYEAMQEYDLSVTYPTTVFDFLTVICTRLGWTLSNESITNGDKEITEELFSNLQCSYRDILDEIAELSGSFIQFHNDQLLVAPVELNETTYAETLILTDLLGLTTSPRYGGVNSIVLSRQPQEDNIAETDADDIAANGLTELRIDNNKIMDNDREGYIGAIYDNLHGLALVPFTADTIGFGFFEIGDRLLINGKNGSSYSVVILNYKVNVSGGLKETIGAVSPTKTQTNYNFAGIVGKRITQTEIQVDKQNNNIEVINDIISGDNGLISEISLANGNITTTAEQLATLTTEVLGANQNPPSILDRVASLEVGADAIEATVKSIGGVNLLKNSVGLKGSLAEWSDNTNNPLNTGTVIQTTDVSINTESGCGIQLSNQYIQQTFPTIQDQLYCFYCRFNKTGTLHMKISDGGQNVVYEADVMVADVNDGDWGIFKVAPDDFKANASSMTVRISVPTGSTAILSDMVVKLGDCNGWVQAPNEVYGKTYRFDKDGFSITSPTDNFKSLLTNTLLAVYDTSGISPKEQMYVGKDAVRVSGLTAQEQVVVQRTNNSASSLRIIPTDTGAMFVIND